MWSPIYNLLPDDFVGETDSRRDGITLAVIPPLKYSLENKKITFMYWVPKVCPPKGLLWVLQSSCRSTHLLEWPEDWIWKEKKPQHLQKALPCEFLPLKGKNQLSRNQNQEYCLCSDTCWACDEWIKEHHFYDRVYRLASQTFCVCGVLCKF